ncbi:MAG TPA: hypothetical protein VHP14_16000 [Anaerolineales bacterium]|nr:hypothetical protein [Anaerolineales bacterium]
MRKHVQSLIGFFTLAILILACALPVPSAGSPTQSGETEIVPASPDANAVGTVVAMTLAALAPGVNTPAAPATSPTPIDTTISLPHTLYYLATDSAGIIQVFRIEKDGTTRHQITSEAVNVGAYDVSPVDGGVAYVSNNHLYYANPDGSERRILLNGGEVDTNNPFMSTVSSPVFSPDGQTIAYGYKGLQIYSFVSDESHLIIKNQIDDVSGLLVPKELYSPERYSPDGSKLLITLGYYESASSAIYSPATGDLVRLDGGEGAVLCCDDVEWSFDSASIYAASPTVGMFNSGMWKIDAATGKVTTLIQAEVGGGTYNLVDEAYLAPDGQLYFFFATASISQSEGAITRSPLQPYRSKPDGVTDRTLLNQQSFELLNEALWAPNASFVVVTLAPAREIYDEGQAEIVYFDGRPNAVLVPSAQQLKWGP